jgi:hypothetical protein
LQLAHALVDESLQLGRESAAGARAAVHVPCVSTPVYRLQQYADSHEPHAASRTQAQRRVKALDRLVEPPLALQQRGE